jgi:hypothetical protein
MTRLTLLPPFGGRYFARVGGRAAEGIPLILDAFPDLSMTGDGAVSGMPCSPISAGSDSFI